MVTTKKPQVQTGALADGSAITVKNSCPNNSTQSPKMQHIGSGLYEISESQKASQATEGSANLGTTTDTVGHLVQKAVLKQDLLTAAKELLPDENRLQACLSAVVDVGKPVGIEYASNTEIPKARLTNVCRCDNPWLCPNCGPIIAEKKARMIKEDLTAWAQAGHTSAFVVFTLQHFQFEKLADIDKRLDQALKKMLDTRAGRAFKGRWNIAGRERSPDVTYGENGWHSHRNFIFFLERRILSDQETLDFEQELSGLWRGALDSVGGYADVEHGCKVRFGDIFDVADYIASKAMGCGSASQAQQLDQAGAVDGWGVAQELTKHQYKQGAGLTPSDLLRIYLVGDHPMISSDQAGRLWQEYARVFKGKKFVDTSPGFRARLDELKEQFKDELTEALGEDEKPEYVGIAYLGPEAWRQVVKLQLALWLLAEVKECGGDPSVIRAFLLENEITQVYYPDLDDRLPDWWFAPGNTPKEVIDQLREFNDFVKDWNSQPWPVG